MKFVKLEGDAVFCYAHGTAFPDGERFIELIEMCYFEFSNRLLNMARNTTCPCAACAAIGYLDLKFVCHYGRFVIDTDAGGVDLAGPDVILVHRLLKNTVTETDGVKAYALLTDACLQRLPPSLTLPRHKEHYESFGATTAGVHALSPVIAAMRDARRIYIDPKDADLVFEVKVPIPPSAAWKYWVDATERQRWYWRWFSKKPDRVTRNARGRVGSGTAVHCNHGPGTWCWEVVDWQPAAYVSFDVTGSRSGKYVGMRDQFATYEFTPTADGGARVVQRVRLKHRGTLSLLTYRVQRQYITAFQRRLHRHLLGIIAEDNAVA
jgi:uncharacterized protein YndB with AHSA1/START domain